jgi:hypothetical protein
VPKAEIRQPVMRQHLPRSKTLLNKQGFQNTTRLKKLRLAGVFLFLGSGVKAWALFEGGNRGKQS